ncbi:hypothetical protein KIL84_020953 [Mauremys mutica]|uniref:Uncharacterized protein n=1 Tax=Mauremys mutica TaxID=74926 RepID=A0A9D4B0A6_9SAUR|nr:hypothetical protein KIL84_020953 [Mauremys mutica]
MEMEAPLSPAVARRLLSKTMDVFTKLKTITIHLNRGVVETTMCSYMSFRFHLGAMLISLPLLSDVLGQCLDHLSRLTRERSRYMHLEREEM